VNGETGEYTLLQSGGTVIGLFPEAEFQRGSAHLEPGDILVACTDGVTEACNMNEEEYGTDKLAACVARHRHKNAQAIVQAVLQEVNAFAKDGPHIDDKVLMVVKTTKEGVDTASNKGAVSS